LHQAARGYFVGVVITVVEKKSPPAKWETAGGRVAEAGGPEDDWDRLA